MEIVLRYITDAVFTGDSSVLEDRCLSGQRGTSLALGVPGASVVEGIRKMKDSTIEIAIDCNSITPADCSALMREVGTTFNCAAAAVAWGNAARRFRPSLLSLRSMKTSAPTSVTTCVTSPTPWWLVGPALWMSI
jgi:hypothetical protein